MSRDMRRRSRSRSPRRGGVEFRGKPMNSENKFVYLSNLAYELRWMELKTLIREKAGEVTFVEIIEQRNGRPKGCALVEFTTIEGAREAIGKLNGAEMHGRNIVAKDIKNPESFFRMIKEETGIDFLDKSHGPGGARGGGGGGGAGGPGGQRRRGESPPRNGGGLDEYELFGLSPQFLQKMAITPPLVSRIFVCNIAFNATSGHVWDIFAMAGKVTYVDLQIDKEGKSKGQAIVEFSHPLEAVQAISMFHNQKYYDRTLAVKMDRFEKRNPLGKGEMPRGLASVGMGLGAGGAPLTDIASVISTQLPPPVQQMQPMQQQLPPMQQMMQQQQQGPPQMLQQHMPMQPQQQPMMMQQPQPMPQHLQQPMQHMQQPMGGFKTEMDALMGALNGQMGGGGGPPPQQQQLQPEPMYGGGRPQGGGGGGGYEGAYGSGPAAPAPGPGGFGASPVRGGGMQPQPQQQQQYGREPSFRDSTPAFGGNPMSAGYSASNGSFNGGAAGGFAVIKKEVDYAPAYSGAYPDRGVGQMGGVGGGGAVGGGAGGGGPAFSSRVILIKNLPHDYTWQIVRDRSMTFGEVEQCDLVNPGVARVRFSLNSEAERARGALAGTSVEGRPISVDFVM